MSHTIGPDATAIPAKQVHHGGMVCRIAEASFTETASGSNSIAMMALPAGAQVIGVTLYPNGAVPKGGTASYNLAVYIDGNSWVATASAQNVHYGKGHGESPGSSVVGLIGKRLTSSANVILRIYAGTEGTNVASSAYKLVCMYNTDFVD